MTQNVEKMQLQAIDFLLLSAVLTLALSFHAKSGLMSFAMRLPSQELPI